MKNIIKFILCLLLVLSHGWQIFAFAALSIWHWDGSIIDNYIEAIIIQSKEAIWGKS